MPKAPFGIRIGQTIISELRGVAPRARDAKVALGSPSPMVRQKQARRAQQSCARQSDRSSPGSTRRRSTSDPQAYNRPQTPVHRQDKSVAQPVYCYADKRAQRLRPEELDRGYAPLRGLQRQQHCGGTGATADLRRLWNGGGPAPTHPKEEGGAHSAQPNAYPLYNYTTPILVLLCSCYPIFIRNWVLVCAVRARA